MRFSDRNLDTTNTIPESEKSNEKCLIVYIDRFNPGQYKYIPIRYGTILSINKEVYGESERIFLSISLEEYCNSNCNFFEYLSDIYPNCPKLTDSDSENTNDGHYIVKIQNNISEKLEATKDSWAKSVREISKAKTFRDKKIIYYRAEVFDESGLLVTKCESGNTYKLAVTYYNPGELTSEIKTDFYFPLLRPGLINFTTGCAMDKIFIPFMVDKVYQRIWTSVSIFESNMNKSIDFDIELEPVYLNRSNMILIAGFALVIFAPLIFSFFDINLKENWDNEFFKCLFELAKWVLGFVLFVRIGRPVS